LYDLKIRRYTKLHSEAKNLGRKYVNSGENAGEAEAGDPIKI